ncbi:unnamed protein product [Amoebophrya sp. A25]|nr:unnamed protein product [Amoebophrya sp. A25]|eukprot:GSA25T00024482001.1
MARKASTHALRAHPVAMRSGRTATACSATTCCRSYTTTSTQHPSLSSSSSANYFQNHLPTSSSSSTTNTHYTSSSHPKIASSPSSSSSSFSCSSSSSSFPNLTVQAGKGKFEGLRRSFARDLKAGEYASTKFRNAKHALEIGFKAHLDLQLPPEHLVYKRVTLFFLRVAKAKKELGNDDHSLYSSSSSTKSMSGYFAAKRVEHEVKSMRIQTRDWASLFQLFTKAHVSDQELAHFFRDEVFLPEEQEHHVSDADEEQGSYESTAPSWVTKLMKPKELRGTGGSPGTRKGSPLPLAWDLKELGAIGNYYSLHVSPEESREIFLHIDKELSRLHSTTSSGGVACPFGLSSLCRAYARVNFRSPVLEKLLLEDGKRYLTSSRSDSEPADSDHINIPAGECKPEDLSNFCLFFNQMGEKIQHAFLAGPTVDEEGQEKALVAHQQKDKREAPLQITETEQALADACLRRKNDFTLEGLANVVLFCARRRLFWTEMVKDSLQNSFPREASASTKSSMVKSTMAKSTSKQGGTMTMTMASICKFVEAASIMKHTGLSFWHAVGRSIISGSLGPGGGSLRSHTNISRTEAVFLLKAHTRCGIRCASLFRYLIRVIVPIQASAAPSCQHVNLNRNQTQTRQESLQGALDHTKKMLSFFDTMALLQAAQTLHISLEKDVFSLLPRSFGSREKDAIVVEAIERLRGEK